MKLQLTSQLHSLAAPYLQIKLVFLVFLDHLCQHFLDKDRRRVGPSHAGAQRLAIDADDIVEEWFYSRCCCRAVVGYSQYVEACPSAQAGI